MDDDVGDFYFGLPNHYPLGQTFHEGQILGLVAGPMNQRLFAFSDAEYAVVELASDAPVDSPDILTKS